MFSRYSQFKIRDLENVDQGHDVQHSQLRWQILDFLSDGNNNICPNSHYLWDIQKSRKILELWPWKWRSRSWSRRTELALFDWKCSILYCWFFRILATQQHRFAHKVDTRTHTQRATEVLTIDKICKADLPNKMKRIEKLIPGWWL